MRVGNNPFHVLSSELDIIVLLLAFAGASIDAASYLAFGRVFTANVTGNTILLGLAVTQGDTGTMLRRGIALFGYVIGAAITELLRNLPRRSENDLPSVKPGLYMELLFLVILAISWWFSGASPAQPALIPLVMLSAVAMGSQSVTVRNLNIEGITTTYITGMITALAAGVIDWLQLKLPKQPIDVRKRPPQINPQKPGLLALAWLVYAVGAVAGGVVVMHWWFLALLLPISTIIFVISLVNSLYRRNILIHSKGNLQK